MNDGTHVTNYQLYGLLQSAGAATTSSVVNGFANDASLSIEAQGYGMSADALAIQSEQVFIDASAAVNKRMNHYNHTAANNLAMRSAMGVTNTNDTISRTNEHRKNQDTAAINRSAFMRNLGIRSQIVSANAAKKSKEIASRANVAQSVLGAVSGIASGVGAYGMFMSSRTTPAPKTAPADTIPSSGHNAGAVAARIARARRLAARPSTHLQRSNAYGNWGGNS